MVFGRRRTSSDRERVIVVGAGLAGLAAASDLTADGYQVTIVEAQDRIGGRILTDRSLGTPVDLGAARIRGWSGNPLADLVARAGAETVAAGEDDRVLVDGFDTLTAAFAKQGLDMALSQPVHRI